MHSQQACLFKYITVPSFHIYAQRVKMPLKGEVGGHALYIHGNYIVDRGKSWKNHEILFLNFCGNPGSVLYQLLIYSQPSGAISVLI